MDDEHVAYTYRGRQPAVPGLADTRAQLNRALAENTRLREELANTPGAADVDDVITTLRAELTRATERAVAAERRADDLERALDAARVVSPQAPSVEPPQDDDAASVPTEHASVRYATLTADQLRLELDRRELPTSGTKSQLIDRLREDDAR